MKLVASEMAPYLTELFNRSLAAECFSQTFIAACIIQIFKKPSLGSADVRSYRAISNLSVELKPLERVAVRQLITCTYSPLISCRYASPGSGLAIQQKRPSCGCYLIFCSPSTVTLQPSSCWTCRLQTFEPWTTQSS